MSLDALNRILAKDDKVNNQSLLYLLQTLGEKRLFTADEFNDIRDALRFLNENGGGTDTQVIDWNGPLQFTQGPTSWYHKQIAPQTGNWLTPNWNTFIGTNPTGFSVLPSSERLIFNSYLEKAFIYLHNINTFRTINIKWYKFNKTQGNNTPTNIVEICNISKAISSNHQPFILNTDFIINNTNLNEGDFITFVINQESNLSATVLNIGMKLIFKKI